MPESHPSRGRLTHLLSRALVLLSGVYGMGLLVYLALRIAVQPPFWWLAFLHNFTPYYFVPLLILIPLLLLARARAMALRLLPLLLIGALWYGSYWLPKATAVAADDALAIKVVSFNVLILTSQFDHIAAWLRGTDADLILLQEVGGLEPQTVIDALEDDYPYTVNLAGTTVMALSRYPVAEARIVDLGGWYIDRFVLDVEDKPLAVYNIHMVMPVLTEPRLNLPVQSDMVQLFLQYDEAYRDMLLRNLLAILADEDLPYIAAGDFNTSDNALIYNDMRALMGDSVRETYAGMGATWPASVGDDALPGFIPPMLRIDYIWHSDDLRALSSGIGPDLGSDHLPIMATLALN